MRSYRDVLSVGEARGLFLALLGVRLGYSMFSLSVVLLAVDRTGSYRVAGATTGAFFLVAGLTAPLRGTLVDRYGQTRPLLVFVPSWCAAVALMPVADEPVPLVVLAGVAGAMSPPLVASARPLWRDIVGAERLRTAYALDSVQTQTAMVVGPLAAAAVSTLLDPALTLWIIAAAVALGGLQFGSLPASRRWRGEPRLAHVGSAVRAAGMRTLIGLALCIGAVYGALAVALPAWADQHGSAGRGGLLLGALSLGGVLGGAWWGTRTRATSPVRALVTATCGVAVVVSATPVTGSAPLLGAELFVVGFCFGVGNVLAMELIDRAAPPGTAVSAFTWMIQAEMTGMAAASALAGELAESRTAAAALAVALLPAAALPVVLATRRRTLRAGQWPASSQLGPTPTDTSSGTLNG